MQAIKNNFNTFSTATRMQVNQEKNIVLRCGLEQLTQNSKIPLPIWRTIEILGFYTKIKQLQKIILGLAYCKNLAENPWYSKWLS